MVTELGGATLSDESPAALLEHDGPGNVRELRNRLQRATLLAKDAPISPFDLDLVGARPPAIIEVDPDPEREAIEEALLRMKGVVAKATAELGMSRRALYRRMERLGIVMERRPR